MTVKVCAYCDNPITGDAIPIPDYAERTAHALAYWHPLGSLECVKKVPPTHQWALAHRGGVPVGDRRRLRTRSS